MKITVSGSGGATTFQFDEGRVRDQSMVLEGSLDLVLSSVVPHEVTHTVWAQAFGDPVPRWADEGAALLGEDGEEQAKHGQLMQQMLDKPSRLIPLRRLFAMKEYPDDVMVLFTQGYSVTRFLVDRKDRPTFLNFIRAGLENGWDKAVQSHYNFQDVEELEDAWLASLWKSADKKEELIPGDAKPVSSGPPTPALAFLSMDGRFIVLRMPVHSYKAVTAYPTPSGPGTAEPRMFYQQVILDSKCVFPLDQIQAATLAGEPVDSKKLIEALPRMPSPEAKGLPVLVAMDGRSVDPIYLRVVKEGTWILTPPVERLQEMITPPTPPPTEPIRKR